ncbi:hypothetical protein [Leucothrix arctica]|uniref:Uncharacterized protein n=1 Tax=Leucothrix arctica TaxID=1481894 RepID=A0A317C5C9_9GAMM|nr:hypothetical protein [Leucothrix arctica]PWQ93421.1 hypothetical protein DKT75_17480 [Leucothrix arctica]
MPKVNNFDTALIERLHSLVFNDPGTRDIIDSGFKAALAVFEDLEYSLPFASYNISIDHFANKIPDEQKGMVGLCRVFILRAGCKMPRPEIHRNSIQRLVSFTGEGAIHSASPGGVDMSFKECAVVSPDKNLTSSFDKSWDVVPENTWHYPVAGKNEDWFTVTFHSAGETEIIDEYWEPNR